MFGLGVQIAAPVLCGDAGGGIILGLLGQVFAADAADAAGAGGKEPSWPLILIATLKYWPDLFRRLFTDAVANGEHILHLAG